MKMPCTENVASEEYADFIIPYTSREELLAGAMTECVDFVNYHYAILYRPMSELAPISLSSFTYTAIPKLYSLLDTTSMEASGILPAARLPALSNKGSGVIIGFVDTGIDYQNPLFRKADGTTRILGLWDQTHGTGNDVPGSPFRPLYGTQYTHEDINQALRSENPLSVVPSQDEDGHGTFLASVAAGNADEDNDFTGAAPEASIAVVKLKPAKQYLRDFFLIREDAVAYQENDIMMGITYLFSLARQYSMPVVVCLGVGTNQGSHVGKSPLGNFLDEMSSYVGTAFIVAAGNETGYAHHYSAVTTAGDAAQTVELKVGENDRGFSMELWAQDVEVYRIGFLSPTGEAVRELPAGTGEENMLRFLLEETEITVYSNIVTGITGSQMIFIRFKNPMPGIWNIMVSSALDISGTFHMWLPVHGFVSDDTVFLRPDPDTTITEPGNAQYPLTVSAYDHATGGIYIHSSRGYSRTGQVKPELAAPGVNVFGAGVSGGGRASGAGVSGGGTSAAGAGASGAAARPAFTRRSGTSVAAAHAAGAAAILLHWGVLERNLFYMNTSVIKTYLTRGAKRNPAITYPNREFGYGTLDLYEAFLRLRV